MSFFDTPLYVKVAAIRDGKLRCTDVVAECIRRIETNDKNINAFISLDADGAMRRAEQLDRLSFDERCRKPLLGIPIAVKDNICTKNWTTTCGSKMLHNFIPPYNATVIDALINAGGIVVGKTNMDEFAMGSSSETSFFGPTRNPNNFDYIPGGSSGGSAAAVAAGFVPAALGSDTGGSIRQPCSHCGVAGLKPTYGRVSRFGLVAFASSLDQIGPIASFVEDLGLMLSVICVEEKRDSTHAGKRFENIDSIYSTDLSTFTIGCPREYFGDGLSMECRSLLEDLIRKLKDAGAKVIDITLPTLQYAIATYYIICTAEASSNLARYDGVKFGYRSKNSSTLEEMYTLTRAEGFGAEVKRRIMLGTYVLSAGYYDAYYMKAAKVRTLISQDFEKAFSSCSVIMSPVAPTCAFKLGEKINNPLQMYLSDIYTVSANLAGIPAISVPCGRVDKLPVGVQFMAPKWREDLLLRVGYAVEKMMV